MTTKRIDDLREALFEQIDRLAKAKDPSAELERSKAMAELAQVVINSAKVEVEYICATDGKGTGFIPETPAIEKKLSSIPGVTGTTVHRIR